MLFIEPTGNWWIDFWNSVGEFFWEKDELGFNYLTRILISILIIVVGFFVVKLVKFLMKKAMKIKHKGPDLDVNAKFFVIKLTEFFIWIGISFLVIAMLKLDVTGLAGVTSAVTVALGLALQDLISCFASGLLLLNQKNIKTDEYISVMNGYGTVEGFVSKIHIIFTYLRTPAGQEITIPNNNMIKAMVTNYTRLGYRRLDYDVNVAYNSDIELTKKVLMDLVKDDPRIYNGTEPVVYVYSLGEYAVGVRIRVVTPFDQYWPLYNEMSEKVLIALQKNGIYIPSSTDRTVTQK